MERVKQLRLPRIGRIIYRDVLESKTYFLNKGSSSEYQVEIVIIK